MERGIITREKKIKYLIFENLICEKQQQKYIIVQAFKIQSHSASESKECQTLLTTKTISFDRVMGTFLQPSYVEMETNYGLTITEMKKQSIFCYVWNTICTSQETN